MHIICRTLFLIALLFSGLLSQAYADPRSPSSCAIASNAITLDGGTLYYSAAGNGPQAENVARAIRLDAQGQIDRLRADNGAMIVSSKPVKRRSCLGIRISSQQPLRAGRRPLGSPGGASAPLPGRARSAPS